MKKITIYKLMALFITAAIFYASCTKETSDVRLVQKLSTSMVTNVRSDSATVTGFVVAAGDGFTEKGICYNTTTGPTTTNSKVKFSDTAFYKKATFNVILSGLNYATKYYARAYAISPSGTLYGEEVNFTTLPIVPALTTTAVTAITGNSASSGGNVTISGGADVTARGVCYSTTQHPTAAGSKTSDGKGTGSFTSSLTGLKGNTTYYLRAYATNSAGTGYGAELSFKTPVDLPVVTTTAISGITKTTAISGGYASYDGGGAITDKGVVWSTSPNPTIADSKLSFGSGDTGKFVSNLSNLAVNTTYHLRAYA
ncbi:MAG: hypothetical protein Q8905_08495, partial [Bacteroidota bacterium]|nr:hypothetical protein [Bacteroidota bacterium]